MAGFFSGIPTKWLLTGLALLAVVAAAYFMNNWIQEVVTENASLKTTNSQLETKLELSQEATEQALKAVDDWKLAFQTYTEEVAKNDARRQEAEQQVRDLYEKFARHDLSLLARRKPSLVERRINAGSADAARLLRCATGSAEDGCPRN